MLKVLMSNSESYKPLKGEYRRHSFIFTNNFKFLWISVAVFPDSATKLDVRLLLHNQKQRHVMNGGAKDELIKLELSFHSSPAVIIGSKRNPLLMVYATNQAHSTCSLLAT
jgi:hypothetical protein